MSPALEAFRRGYARQAPAGRYRFARRWTERASSSEGVLNLVAPPTRAAWDERMRARRVLERLVSVLECEMTEEEIEGARE